mmetsp:Transcript_680/g.1715  ORF Transcript_680/g.1715 Transcript_680/m.1715 type:complete len:146 (+) Transcript_680:157-594(+)|eukprot:jgi/Tetstr1/429288/TSEL_019206.t1
MAIPLSRSFFHHPIATAYFNVEPNATRAHDNELDVDVLEGDTGYTIFADMPGLGQEDIELQLHNRALTVTGGLKHSKEQQLGEGEGPASKRLRPQRAYRRSFQLPNDVDEEKISASIDKGVLQLSLPKRKSALPRQITVSGPVAQ